MVEEKTQHSGSSVVTLTGDLSIRRAREVREALLEAFKEGEEVVVEFEDYEGADLSLIQLLCSIHRTAASCGKTIRLGASTPKRFLDTIGEAGFLRGKCCVFSSDNSCLWVRADRRGAL